MLDIIIPTTGNLTDRIHLLNSIENQVNVDFNDIKVLIRSTDDKKMLNLLKKYSFNIEMVELDNDVHQNESYADIMNSLISKATDSYFTILKDSDMLFNCLALSSILKSLSSPKDVEVDILFTSLQSKTWDTMEKPVVKLAEDINNIEGKIFRTKFIQDNNITYNAKYLTRIDEQFITLSRIYAQHADYLDQDVIIINLVEPPIVEQSPGEILYTDIVTEIARIDDYVDRNIIKSLFNDIVALLVPLYLRLHMRTFINQNNRTTINKILSLVRLFMAKYGTVVLELLPERLFTTRLELLVAGIKKSGVEMVDAYEAYTIQAFKEWLIHTPISE